MSNSYESTKEKVLVCVSSDISTANLISPAKKLATTLNAEWFAVYVEQPQTLVLPEANRDRALDNLRLAEQSGAETFILRGRNIAEEIAKFARERSITRIVVGKPRSSSWRSILSRSTIDQLIRMNGAMNVHVVSGKPGEQKEAPYVIRLKKFRLSDYGSGLVLFLLASLLCFLMYPHFDLSNLIMVYLLGVLVTAIECGRGPAILNSLLSVLAFDFFFVPPRFSFTVEEAQYVVTFVVMFLVAVVISQLTTVMRKQADIARLQERQATAMHGLSQKLASTRGIENVLRVAVQHISEILDCQALALLEDEKGKLNVPTGDVSSVLQQDIAKELTVAHSAFDSGRMVGRGTQNFPKGDILYVPLIAVNSTLGVLALRPGDPKRFLFSEQVRLLESLAKQVALALEVERLTANTHHAEPK